MPTIHPTAIVDPSARIANSVKIGPYCVVGPEITLGTGTVLHNHVVIHALTTLGEDNEVYPFAVLGANPQDRKFQGERAHCVIGDRLGNRSGLRPTAPPESHHATLRIGAARATGSGYS